MSEPEIICERRGAAGFVLLNRPKALNALTHGMVRSLGEALDAWEADPAVRCVVLEGAGGRAFCAGGDIRMLYEAGRAGEGARALAFWHDEYLLNIRIKRFPKPYLSLIDGMVMGGGVGLSLHGAVRVAGDRYLFSMPEVGIGFFPDVGATWALPRLPGRVGAYLALTGARVGPDDAVRLGLGTHRVPSGLFGEVAGGLAAGEDPDAVLGRLAVPPGPGVLDPVRDVIDGCFAGPSVPAILDALDRRAEAGSDFARESAATIRGKAPSSLAIALEQMRRGGAMTFEAAMAAEYRIVARVAAEPDFYEGVRATIIDRDGRPRWDPATLADLPPGFVEGHFAPLDTGELPVPA